MNAQLKKADEYRQTAFVTECAKGKWACYLGGQLIGRVEDKNLGLLEGKALAMMSIKGMRNRRIVEVDRFGQRICVEVDKNMHTEVRR